MTFAGWAQLIALIVVIGVTAPLLGRYMANVYTGTPSRLDRIFGPVERLIYRACRIDPEREQRWNIYALSLLAFSVVGFFLLYVIQRIQSGLPFNPTDMANVQPALAFNTAVSFVTNTNWQSYAGESTMSHLTQMVGLTVQQFVSAAVGMAAMAALIRGLSRAGQRTIGNFWVDLIRTTFRILLPLAFVFAIVLIAGGVIQNTHGFTPVHTVAGATQQIPGGPNASMESIKQLGTNGGDFFNVNSAHPFSNPTDITNFLELYAILIIPFALAFTFGRMVKDKRQGYAVVAVMTIVWLAFTAVAVYAEVDGNPKLDDRGVTQTVTATSPGGNAEGKEVRFGPTASAEWCAATTGTSNGSVNSMHDSYTPLGGMTCLVHMKLGEVRPGRVHRRADGRADAGVPGQEDPGLGGEAGRRLHPRDAGDRAHRHRDLDVREFGLGRVNLQPRRARLHGAHLRLHVGRQQQRVRVRRPHRQHRLHEQRAGRSDVVRTLLPHHPDAGVGRRAGPQAARPRLGGNVPDRHPSVRRARDRRDLHRRRVDLPPRPRARPHRRAARPVIGVR
jgi:K+-transporting ATPase KdpA subunit